MIVPPNMPNITNNVNNDITLLIIAGSHATPVSIYNQKNFDCCLVYVS